MSARGGGGESPPRFPKAARRLALGAVCAAGGAATAFLARWVRRWPAAVEEVYVRGWAESVVPPLSRFTGIVPFAVAELLIGAYALVWARRVIRGRREWKEGRVRLGVDTAWVVGTGLRDLGIAVFTFYLLWGFHYARSSVAERVDLPIADAVTEGEVLRLSDRMVRVANLSYRTLHGRDDAGAPTTASDDPRRIHASLSAGWERAGRALPLDPLMTSSFGPPKEILLSPLAAWMGITGVYFPFTGEALVVATTPGISLGLSYAHEQAHQRGITDEGEATFLGFIAAMESGNPYLRYSAAARAGMRLRAAAVRKGGPGVLDGREEWLPGVLRDLEDLRAYQIRHQGPISRAATRVNDAYLRANRVEGGVESYDRVTTLLLRFSRLQGWSAGSDAGGRIRDPGPGGRE